MKHLVWAVVVLVLCGAVAAAEPKAPPPLPPETSTIVSLAQDYNKLKRLVDVSGHQDHSTPESMKEHLAQVAEMEKLLEQLKAQQPHWDAMYLAACQLGVDGNKVLLPLLASAGPAAVTKVADLLVRYPQVAPRASADLMLEIGTEAIKPLMEQYKAAAPDMVRQVAVGCVQRLVSKKGIVDVEADELLRWTLQAAADKEDSVVAQSSIILRVLYYSSTDNAEKAEHALWQNLKDARPTVRIAAADVLTQIVPKADYVKTHVLTAALKSKDPVERDAAIRLCPRLPVSEDVLNALFECSFDKEQRVRVWAAQALGEMGPKTLPLAGRMLKKLQEGNEDSLPSMLAVLRQSKENWDAIEESLVKALGSKGHYFAECLDFLMQHAASLKDGTIQKLVELLDDPDKFVRMMDVRALHPFAGRKGVREAVSKRREKETDKGVQQLLDLFLKEPAAQPE